ncbi:hypothetical protein Cgig2_020856 [Carnegiea gigantea]|uniref:Pollen Ole e 1 allergen and extensin family protein n=1 Tax=Carnegiea gigantea TaxID=171969 RepID=A0A9Q1KJC4_9CARY|nr:hypothetical protein Cgig2_020856 [Carnegiea gigantea]
MALPRLVLAGIVAFAFVGIVSADYRKGRSLKPYPPPGKENQSTDDFSAIKIQGTIHCNQAGRWTPVRGATARVTCLALNVRGYESAPFSVVTPRTDERGFFHINLGKYQLANYRLRSCRVFLEAPAPGICNVPTDINHGLTGAPLTNYRPLGDLSALYFVGPFVYNPSPY